MTALVTTSQKIVIDSQLLESHHGRLELWLRGWRIDINVAKSTAALYSELERRIQRSGPVQFIGEPKEHSILG
jgi:hypothetical protein